MSQQTAGFSFILEFSQTAINKIVNSLFRDNVEAFPKAFNDDDEGQPVLSTKDSATGQLFYRKYLIEGMAGYELSLNNPFVKLRGGDLQQIEFQIDFDLSINRQLLIKSTDDALQIPDDEQTIDPNANYPIVYDSGVYPRNPPSISGRISIALNLSAAPFGSGNRVHIKASESNLGLVNSVSIESIDLPDQFLDFIEILASKVITKILASEIKEIDVTPQFGVFDAFDIQFKEAISLRIIPGDTVPSLAVGMQEYGLVENGDPHSILSQAEGEDYSLQVDEGFTTYMMGQLQNDEVIPRRFELNGTPSESGPIFLHNIRLYFVNGGLGINTIVEYDGAVELFAKTIVKIGVGLSGEVETELSETQLHVRLNGLTGGVQYIFNLITFNVLDKLLGAVIGATLGSVINPVIQTSVEDFLSTSKLTFAFESPIRNTSLISTIKPSAFIFEEGRSTIRGTVNIEEQ